MTENPIDDEHLEIVSRRITDDPLEAQRLRLSISQAEKGNRHRYKKGDMWADEFHPKEYGNPFDIVVTLLHDWHAFSDERPLRGYNHCECRERARKIIEALHANEAR